VKPPLLYVNHSEYAGVDLFNVACEKDLEGIVAKLSHGLYRPEATTWVKIRIGAIPKLKAGLSSSI
jgi:ATP-dependent DNA ligase